MTKEEFLKAFLPDYEEIFNGTLNACIRGELDRDIGMRDLIERINNRLLDLHFPEMIEHYSCRQREICAETYWSEMGDELMKWRVYEKIKQARKPQSYGP
ncbi:MAG: hypothetical protein LBJ63_07645 [Prevotellaceae bacterium]|jgi:hypothetical protein|nr:hypothetical protein [Prevotellaceae bacterium]